MELKKLLENPRDEFLKTKDSPAEEVLRRGIAYAHTVLLEGGDTGELLKVIGDAWKKARVDPPFTPEYLTLLLELFSMGKPFDLQQYFRNEAGWRTLERGTPTDMARVCFERMGERDGRIHGGGRARLPALVKWLQWSWQCSPPLVSTWGTCALDMTITQKPQQLPLQVSGAIARLRLKTAETAAAALLDQSRQQQDVGLKATLLWTACQLKLAVSIQRGQVVDVPSTEALDELVAVLADQHGYFKSLELLFATKGVYTQD
jgi:hypothetical protein